MEVWLAADQLSGNCRRLHKLSLGRAIEDGMGKDVGLSDDVVHEADRILAGWLGSEHWWVRRRILGEAQQLRLERAGPDAGEAEYVTAGDVVREVGTKLVCESD
jgi:hypothetical protein